MLEHVHLGEAPDIGHAINGPGDVTAFDAIILSLDPTLTSVVLLLQGEARDHNFCRGRALILRTRNGDDIFCTTT